MKKTWHWGWLRYLFLTNSVILGNVHTDQFPHLWSESESESESLSGLPWTPQTALSALFCTSPTPFAMPCMSLTTWEVLSTILSPLDFNFLQSDNVWGSSSLPLTRAWVSPSLLVRVDWLLRAHLSDLHRGSMLWASPHTFSCSLTQSYNDFPSINWYWTKFLYCLLQGTCFSLYLYMIIVTI